ncbi:MAG: NADH-quinone oxidoreductase subunit L [Clostridium thermopalmarium]|uniref:NADH-quinone oxidoreductase subunit 5 family protein n=1 Tax=Clostridium thermopalmarium TaxID=29373 RepID=UPI00235581E7|nr:proton-conducting transporter membrane subunit [Clostridium thermopalmarium]MBE6044541.1 NADH-quinone oxidoreductase subunit L [Clostridium thermopalmarium]
MILALILFPLLSAIIIFLLKNDNIRNLICRASALITCVLTFIIVCKNFDEISYLSISMEKTIDYLMMAIEILIAIYIIYISIKNRKYLVTVFAAFQTPLLIWFELTQEHDIEIISVFAFDKLTAIMVFIVGVIGSLICLYAVGYMKWYHIHHKEYEERKNFFLSVIFLFLSAMFGLVLSNNLIWMYFFWEITSFCSYLLIGYTKTEEAKNNSFRALAINLGGGFAFAVAIVLIGMNLNTLELSVITTMKPGKVAIVSVFLLCIAAITKSAQFPFSSWLLGAMVAPTPSSALLHSATMVKAGVYLLIRLSPLLGNTVVGKIIVLIGAVTFLIGSLIAITQSDGKKVLAYSTIANLGLIVICAGIGTEESLWAAILLVIFHSISKSLLFLSVGSAEHQLGSRNVEDMDRLKYLSRRLSLYMIIGIAGMYLAPFGMLISKWVAMKAFIDSKNILTVLILTYGSAATLFYWTKWLGKLVANANRKVQIKHTFHLDEEVPIFIQTVLVALACFSFPFISKYVIIPYLSSLFRGEIAVPISSSDVNIMIIMLSMLIILPISFIPIHKKDKRRIAPIYMGGENIGDNESFNGALGINRKVELCNWYMEDIFNRTKLTFWSNIISISILSLGVILIIGGMVI